jgi:hypothetical protein
VSKFDSFMQATQKKKKGGTAPASPAIEKQDGQKTAPPPLKRTAKRDDPDYKQALAYVRRDTHRRVMMRLAGEEREFSDLVETLLAEWLNS